MAISGPTGVFSGKKAAGFKHQQLQKQNVTSTNIQEYNIKDQKSNRIRLRAHTNI